MACIASQEDALIAMISRMTEGQIEQITMSLAQEDGDKNTNETWWREEIEAAAATHRDV